MDTDPICADLTDDSEDMPNVHDGIAAVTRGEQPTPSTDADVSESFMNAAGGDKTSIADYVWLPIRSDGGVPRIEWLDEWTPDDFA